MEKIRTYVDGLDEALGGGLPVGSVTLVTGPPGTMKSTVCFAALHRNAQRGVRGLYVSLEQARDSLERQMEGLGYARGDAGDCLSVLDLSLLRERMEETGDRVWLDFFKMYTQSIRQSFPYELLALDSLDALEILARFRDHRRDLFHLLQWLRRLKATCLLIGELPRDPPPEVFSKHREEFLADGILHLRLEKRGEFEVQRRIRVVKLRGARHETGYRALVFDGHLRVTQVLA